MLETLQMKHKHDTTWTYKTFSTLTLTLQTKQHILNDKAGESMFTKVGQRSTSGQHQSIHKPHLLALVCFF